MPAEFVTSATLNAGLTAYVGATTARPKHNGIDDDAIAGEDWQDYNPEFINNPDPGGGAVSSVQPAFTPHAQFGPASAEQQYGLGDPWFEQIIIIPRSKDFGLLLSTQQQVFELYNADRYATHDLTAVLINTPSGVTFTDLPSLPETLAIQRNLLLTLQVTTDAPAVVDDTIDFTFDSGAILVAVGLTFSTIVLWGHEPEDGYDETLRFLVDIMIKKAGSEQRVSLREYPRQFFDFRYLFESGTERARFENLLFNHQDSVFGLPIWHEQTRLTSAAAINDTVMNVVSTDYADYRVGELAIVITDQRTFDALIVASLTATTLTFSSPVLNNHAVGTKVMPLRTAIMAGIVPGARFPVGLSSLQVGFQVKDNDAGAIASAAGFGTYNSKVLIEDLLGVSGQAGESFEHEFITLDPGFGDLFRSSTHTRGRRSRPVMLYRKGKQELWEFRQLMHSLGGPLTSFYLPTHLDDMTAVAGLTSGASTIDIEHIGYTANVQSRAPKAIIRITFNNGDPALIRVVSGSIESSSTVEQLTLGDTWPDNYTLAEIERVEFVELVRMDSNDVKIRHEPGFQFKRCTFPVQSLIA